MKAIWLESNRISIREVPKPSQPGEALIKIRKAGICSTDLELVRGYYPYTGILGHEFVGEVVEIPSPPAPLPASSPLALRRQRAPLRSARGGEGSLPSPPAPLPGGEGCLAGP